MKKDKLLDNLWEAAREEKPQVSYEQVAEKLQAALPTAAGLGTMAWLWKQLSLNNFLILSGLGIVSVVAWFSVASPQQTETAKLSKGTKESKEVVFEPANQDSALLNSANIPKESPQAVLADTLVPSTNTQAIAVELEEKKTPSKAEATKTPPLREDNLLPSEQLAIAQDTLSLPVLKDTVPDLEPAPSNAPEHYDHALPQRTRQEKEAGLILRKTDGEAQVEQFFQQIRDWGLVLDRKSEYAYKGAQLEYVYLFLQHEKGLNFKLKGNGFEELEINVSLGSDGKLRSFRYRFNQEVFTKAIPLNLKGFKTYSFGPGFRGMSGTTNINIEN